MQNTMTSNKT